MYIFILFVIFFILSSAFSSKKRGGSYQKSNFNNHIHSNYTDSFNNSYDSSDSGYDCCDSGGCDSDCSCD